MNSSSQDKTIALEKRVSVDAKLYSPSAARNSAPLSGVLALRLPNKAEVLEIGSGTGEHAEALCLARPDITWTPSDPNSDSRRSQAARASEIPNLESPLDLDLLQERWAHNLGVFDALVCSNVIHISPWDVAINLAQASDSLLKKDGFVFLYGPFTDGEKTAASNLKFDANLKSRNPAWGVRALDAVTALFSRHTFALVEKVEMPANNLSLIFKRAL